MLNLRSGNKYVQLIGVIYGLIALYYGYYCRIPILTFIGATTLMYDGYLLIWEPQCVCINGNLSD